jgi:MerR family redox-sensitive transcriptional activator SoxR
MTIGELSRRTGLATSAIRYYEEEGLLPRAARAGGRRVFDDDAVARLTVIQLAKEAGFTVAETRQLVARFATARWRELAERKLKEIEATAARLRTMSALLRALLECECFDLETCGRVLQKHGRRR